MYNSINLAVRTILKKKGSPETSNVLFLKDRTVATDGARLLEITTPKKMVASNPLAVFHKEVMDKKYEILIPAEALSNIKIKSADDQVFFTTVGDDVRLSQVKKDVVIHHEIKPVSKLFPNYKEVIPKGTPIAQFSVNARLLTSVLAVLSRIAPDHKVSFKVYSNNASVPIEIIAESTEQMGRGLVMPLQSKV